MQRPAKCKVVVLGDAQVGKTSIINRFVHNDCKEEYVATIGVDFLAKTVPAEGRTSGSMRLQIWDTAGQDRFRSLARSYVQDAAAAIIVYDITRSASLQSARDWFSCVRQECGDSTIIALVGNKADLADNSRQVSVDDGRDVARELGANVFAETSGSSGLNVEELFQEVVRALPSDLQGSQLKGQQGLLVDLLKIQDQLDQQRPQKCLCWPLAKARALDNGDDRAPRV